jgi:phage N-6-adenine-methyltransferase
MNTDLHFSSKTDLWSTPQDFFDKLNEEFNFTLDVCATPENAKCLRFYTVEDDGLAQSWTGTVWCNPPYGRTISKWIQKGYESSLGGGNSDYAYSFADGHKVLARFCNER